MCQFVVARSRLARLCDLMGCVFSVKCVDMHMLCRVIVSVAAIARMSIVSRTAAACLIIYASLLWHAAGSCIHNMWVTTTHDEFWVLMGLVWCAGEDEPSVSTLDPTERRHFEAWTGLRSPQETEDASQRHGHL